MASLPIWIQRVRVYSFRPRYRVGGVSIFSRFGSSRMASRGFSSLLISPKIRSCDCLMSLAEIPMAPRIAGFALVVSLLVFASPGAGQEKYVGGKFDQTALHKALRDVINTGADLFNLQGDYAGCYRL